MSNEERLERNEYMRNVKWTTGIYLLGSTVSIVLAVAGVYWGLKGDIKDTRADGRAQIQGVYYRLNSKIDSLKGFYDLKFQSIEERLDNIPEPKTIYIHSKSPKTGLFTQKRINGQIVFIPFK